MIERRFASEIKNVMDMLETRVGAWKKEQEIYDKEMRFSGNHIDYLRGVKSAGEEYHGLSVTLIS
jgi:hypothetical protein